MRHSQDIKKDAEVQLLEDVICLVFIEPPGRDIRFEFGLGLFGVWVSEDENHRMIFILIDPHVRRLTTRGGFKDFPETPNPLN